MGAGYSSSSRTRRERAAAQDAMYTQNMPYPSAGPNPHYPWPQGQQARFAWLVIPPMPSAARGMREAPTAKRCHWLYNITLAHPPTQTTANPPFLLISFGGVAAVWRVLEWGGRV
jgi:hypothetical protein